MQQSPQVHQLLGHSLPHNSLSVLIRAWHIGIVPKPEETKEEHKDDKELSFYEIDKESKRYVFCPDGPMHQGPEFGES